MDQVLFVECTEYLKELVKLDLPGWYCIEISFNNNHPSSYICGVVSSDSRLMYAIKYQRENKTRLRRFRPLYTSDTKFTGYECKIIERKPGYIKTTTKDLRRDKIISHSVIYCDETVENFVLRRLIYETKTNIS